uniref:C-type lectin domain-containing protein n=1 Tax=Stomoxys calcitrans TaxID=35570 RepID=A0A1I8PPX6_STOCA
MNIPLRNLCWILTCLVAGISLPVTAVPQVHIASDGTKYLIESEAKYNWLQAHTECVSSDMQFAVLDSAEKNQAFVELLQQIDGKLPNLWIGHHDNFNTAEQLNRRFFSIINGYEIDFNNWDKGEPNNALYSEHCVHIDSSSDFRWNDHHCENKYGYVCEEPQKSTNVSCDMLDISKTVYELNQELSEDHKNHQNEVQVILNDNRLQTQNVLHEWQQSSMQTLDKSQKSINEIFARKPYLSAVIADVGPPIKQIIREAYNEISQFAHEAQHAINSNSVDTQTSIMNKSEQFHEKLDENTNAVDGLLTQRGK